MVVEGDVLDAEVTTKDFDSEFVVLNAVDILAKLLNHDLLDDGFDHWADKVLIMKEVNYKLYYIRVIS